MRYKRKRKNNKAFLFFTVLVLASYIFISFGQRVNSNSENQDRGLSKEKEVQSLPEECPGCRPVIEEEIIYEQSEMNVVMIPEEYTIDITGEFAEGFMGEALPSVMGASSLFNCGDYNRSGIIDSVTKLCPSGDTTLEYDRGLLGRIWDFIFRSDQQVRIDSENSDFKFTMVTYPLAFFLGQHVVQDSNREANIESPNYSSSGQVIDANYTLKTQSPHLVDELVDYLDETHREDFGVKTEIDIIDSQNGSSQMREDEGEIQVQNAAHEPEPECFCDDERISTSDFNPFNPNRQGFEGGGYFRQHIPGWSSEEDREMGCLDVEGDSIEMIGLGEGAVPACLDLLEGFRGFVQSIFSRPQFDDCADEENGSVCTDLKGFVVKMSPIFGDPNYCESELCANAYLADAYRAGLGPQQVGNLVTSSSDPTRSMMFFIGTPCTANLYISGRAFPVRLTCLWDASPLLLDYNLQAMFKSPGQEGFPQTFNHYWHLVEQAIGISAEMYGLQ